MYGSGNLSGASLPTLKPVAAPKAVAPKPVKCKKGFTKRRGKCVKEKKKAVVKGSHDGKGIK